MSAVSAESPRGSADLTKSSASSSPSAAETPPNGAAADFGPNQWLVDELYQRYLADPGSVDQAWWSFFSDYRSGGGNGDDAPEAGSNGSDTTAPPHTHRGTQAQP